MKKHLWWVILVLVVGFVLWREYGQKRSTGIAETTPAFKEFTSKSGKYSMLVPADWEVQESTESSVFTSRLVYLPRESGSKLGNIGEISMTIVSSPSASQPLSSQTEFDQWLASPVQNATDGAVVKISNDTIDGVAGVRLAELEPIPDLPGVRYWSVTSWWRKQGVNYYLNMMGNGANFTSELGTFDWMLTKFSFE